MTGYDRFILGLTIWREARNQPLVAMVGVASVIMNRAKDRRWPDTVHEVCLQAKQFSCYNAGDPNAVKFPQIGATGDWEAWMRVASAIDEAVEKGNDVANGANHYHSIPAGSPLPRWADAKKVVAKHGAFTFYRL